MCLLAAMSVSAALLPSAAKATLVFQVTPGDFNVTTGALTPDVGPTATLGVAGSVTLDTTNLTPSGADALNFSGNGGFQLSSTLTSTGNFWTIFAVILPKPVVSPETIVGGATGSLQFRLDDGVNIGEPALLARGQYQYGNASVVASTTAYSLVTATNSPGTARPNSAIFTNNGVVVGDTGGDGHNVGNITRFGAAANGGSDNEFFTGDIAEVQVYNTALSTTDRQTIETQLLHNFGILSSSYHWTGTTGPYSVASNWDQNAVPNDGNSSSPTTAATINNGGTAQILPSDNITLKSFYIGDTLNGGSSGNVTQTGGSLTIAYEFILGRNMGIGSYNMSGGSITYNGTTNFGPQGSSSSAPSVLSLSGTASITTTSSGVVTIGEGNAPGAGSGNGVLNMSGNASFNVGVGSQFIVGNDGTATVGVVNMSGGSLTSNSWLTLGREGSTGIINLSGGTITKALTATGTATSGYLSFGSSTGGGNGTLNQTGGTVSNVGSATWLGEQPSSTGTWNMSSGTAALQAVNVGLNGAGTLNISGNAAFTATNVYVNTYSGSTGVVNLTGGVLNTLSVSSGAGTSAVLNLNGGTLQAGGNSTPFVYGFTSGVNILAGGATIDSNGYTISITAPMTSPAGVTGSLTKIGAGTLQLGGSNTYTGTTTVSAGTLQLKAPVTPVTIPNFSFETPGANYTYNPTGASWTFNGQSGVTNGTGFNFNGPVPDGSQAGFVQSYGSIDQAITFPQAGNYTLSFFSEQRMGGNNSYQALQVTVDGTDISSGGFEPGTNWAQYSYVVTETAGSHTIDFVGLDPVGGDNTAFVDDVTLNGNFGSYTSNYIPATSPVVVADNATFDVNGATQAIGSLSGTSLATVTLGSGTLTTGGNGTNTTFAGVISGTGTLIKTGAGIQTLSGSNTYSGGTNVSGGTLAFASPNAFPLFSSLTIGATATASAASHTVGGTKNSLFVSSLTIAGGTNAWTGTLDLSNNDLVIRGGSLATTTNQIKQGFNGGNWQGSGGILSTAAAADSTHLTALGVIQNSVDGTTTGAALYSTFDGQSVLNTDVLVKYTYYGDANLDGHVDGSDYTKIDNGFNNTLTGWFNGDFNYDGVVDGSDYTLIDNAFNTQGATIAASVATSLAEPTSQVSGGSSVPEPASLGLLAIGAMSLAGRRRRHH